MVDENKVIPSQEEIKDYYDNYLSTLISHRNSGRLRDLKYFLCKTVFKEDRVLDVGCGVGVLTKFIGDLGIKVVGIDISPRITSYAKEVSDNKVPFFVHDFIEVMPEELYMEVIKYLGFGPNVICLFDILEHIVPIKRQLFLSNVLWNSVPNRILVSMPSNSAPENLKQIIDEFMSLNDLKDLFAIFNYYLVYCENDWQYSRMIFIKG